MKRLVAVAVASAALLFGSLLALPPTGSVVVLEVFLVVVAILGLRSLVPAPGDGPPSRPRRWWRRRRDQSVTPHWLLRYQGVVMAATRDTVSADGRLLVQLRQLAAERLEHLHEVDMEDDPASARALLGEVGWSVLRPDWADGRGAWDPGVSLGEIDAAVTAIEEL